VERLFDDASLFPPASLPLAQALTAHRAARQGRHGRVVGPFLCPAARLAELDACVASGMPRPPEIGVIAYDHTAPWSRIYATPGLVQVEAPASARPQQETRRVRAYLEIPAHADTAAVGDVLDLVAGGGVRAKVRCGGLTRNDVPSCGWLATVVVGCADRRVRFKATAGLHHPFRSVGPTGPSHGFVNLLAAAAAAHAGADVASVTDILASEESEAPALVKQAWRGRELLTSIGTCSIDETLEGLTSRGLL
jgi:hypothetical protein